MALISGDHQASKIGDVDVWRKPHAYVLDENKNAVNIKISALPN